MITLDSQRHHRGRTALVSAETLRM